MATLDIRNTSEEITEIKFSDEEIIIYISDDDGEFGIHKSDISNLIKALNKAKDFSWY